MFTEFSMALFLKPPIYSSVACTLLCTLLCTRVHTVVYTCVHCRVINDWVVLCSCAEVASEIIALVLLFVI